MLQEPFALLAAEHLDALVVRLLLLLEVEFVRSVFKPVFMVFQEASKSIQNDVNLIQLLVWHLLHRSYLSQVFILSQEIRDQSL